MYRSSHRHALLSAAVAILLAAGSPTQPAIAITPSEMAPHRQTRAEMAAVNGAIIGWLTDQVNRGSGPLGAGPRLDGADLVDVADYPLIAHADLEALLVPTYLAELPAVDGWGQAYEYRLRTTDVYAPNLFLLRSAGADGTFDAQVYSFGDANALAEDLVWADGWQVRAPGPPLLDLGGRLLRCLAELARTHTAMLAWLTDQAQRQPSRLAGVVDLTNYTPISAEALTALLVPQYLPRIPEVDPWGVAYDFYLDTVDILGTDVLAVRSRGRDGLAEGTTYTPGTYPATDLDRDVVFADGVAVRLPVGVDGLLLLDGFETGDDRHWSAANSGAPTTRLATTR